MKKYTSQEKKRFFILRDHFLRYFKKEAERHEKGASGYVRSVVEADLNRKYKQCRETDARLKKMIDSF